MNTPLAAMPDDVAAPQSLGRELLTKVPAVTAFFWIIKVLATTVGETAADFLNTQWNFGLTNTTYLDC